MFLYWAKWTIFRLESMNPLKPLCARTHQHIIVHHIPPAPLTYQGTGSTHGSPSSAYRPGALPRTSSRPPVCVPPKTTGAPGPTHLGQLLLVHLGVPRPGVLGLLPGEHGPGLLVLRLALGRRLVDPGVQVQAAAFTSHTTIRPSAQERTTTFQRRSNTIDSLSGSLDPPCLEAPP